MLPGSLTGITYYLQPELYRLLDTQVIIRIPDAVTYTVPFRTRFKGFFSPPNFFFFFLPSLRVITGVGGRGRSDILLGRSRVRRSLVVCVLQQHKKQLLHVRIRSADSYNTNLQTVLAFYSAVCSVVTAIAWSRRPSTVSPVSFRVSWYSPIWVSCRTNNTSPSVPWPQRVRNRRRSRLQRAAFAASAYRSPAGFYIIRFVFSQVPVWCFKCTPKLWQLYRDRTYGPCCSSSCPSLWVSIPR